MPNQLIIITVIATFACPPVVQSQEHEGVRRASRKTLLGASNTAITSVNSHGAAHDSILRRVVKNSQADADADVRRAPKSAMGSTQMSAANSGHGTPFLDTGCLKRFAEKRLPTWSRNYDRHGKGLLAYKPKTTPLIAFVPVPKAASSTLSNQLTEWDGRADILHKIQNGSLMVNKDIVLFTFVRDPMTRFASAYAEITKRRRDDFRAQPSFSVGQRPWDPQADSNAVNIQLNHFLSDLENGWSGLPLDEHLSAQSHYLADFQNFSFIGRIEDQADWEHLRQEILHVKSSEWNHAVDNIHEDGAKRLIRDAMYAAPTTFLEKEAESSHIKPQIEKSIITRICRLYAVDYCCLSLPVPDACAGLCSNS